MEGMAGSSFKRARVESGEPIESPEAKRLRDDLLGILEDADDRVPTAPDLAFFMKSFGEEIGLPTPTSESGESPASDTGEPRTDLGYLLEASDDELGLPPSSSGDDKEEKLIQLLSDESDAVGFGGGWAFDEDIPSYEFGAWADREVNLQDEEVVFEGLFDYSDGFGESASDFDLPWHARSLSAL